MFSFSIIPHFSCISIPKTFAFPAAELAELMVWHYLRQASFLFCLTASVPAGRIGIKIVLSYQEGGSAVRKMISLLLLVWLLAGCSPKKQVYQAVYLDVFDTVTTLRGYAASEKEFQETADKAHAAMLEYHQLFDIYRECPSGIREVNDCAGLSPVPVDARVMALLQDCRSYYDLTGGKVNTAMGSVLRLWHDARTEGLENPQLAHLPNAAELAEAALHTSFDAVLLDTEAGTVFLTDPAQSLDVGAIAKGWTAQKVSQQLPAGYLLNLGGNICAVGSKPDGSKWNVGIQSPENPNENVCIVGLDGGSVVTSGDYQRFYTVDGTDYHHIIDPDTLMPSQYWRSVTILCPDSGLADCLSTALFLLPLEEGRALAAKCGAEAMWVDRSGDCWSTEGFSAAVRK